MATRPRLSPEEAETNRRAMVESLTTELHQAIEELHTGDQWHQWLDFAKGFTQYSFGNALLIFTQKPDASIVASYRTWQSHGYQVLKGQKALRVLAPMVKRVPLIDDSGQQRLDDNGQQLTKPRVVGYKPVPVFDISQTNGPVPPEPDRPKLLQGQAPPGLWEALTAEAITRGYRVGRAGDAELGRANGITRFATREILVRADVDDAQAVKTLAHDPLTALSGTYRGVLGWWCGYGAPVAGALI